MGNADYGSIIFMTIMILLILLFVVSFSLFIRRMLVNSSLKNTHTEDIEKN